MNTDDLKCRKCGESMFQASNRGAFLKRVNPVGEPFIGECSPCCKHWTGDSNDALVRAVTELEGG